MTTVPPHDLGAERALLAGILVSQGQTIGQAIGLTPGHFYDPRHADLFAAVNQVADHGVRIDAVTVGDQARANHWADIHPQTSVADYLIDLMGSAGYTSVTDIRPYVGIVVEKAEARRTLSFLASVEESINQGNGWRGKLTELQQEPLTAAGIEWAVPARDFLAQRSTPYNWLIPELMERADRVVLTGPEGYGKSTLLRQFAWCCAAGVDPLNFGPLDHPLRVQLFDLENGRDQLGRELEKLHKADPSGDALLVVHRPEGLDLLRLEEVAWLRAMVTHDWPDLVVIGPVYKMVAGDPGKEEVMAPVLRAIDQIRAQVNCAVMMEAHTPHEQQGHRPTRPIGSSIMLRWPEFGLHLDAGGSVTHWRGDRDEGRAWPRALQRGDAWPWVPVVEDSQYRERRMDLMAAVLDWFVSRPGTEYPSGRIGRAMRAEGFKVASDESIARVAEILATRGQLRRRSMGRGWRYWYEPAATLTLVPPLPPEETQETPTPEEDT